jgi:hypothetical protein
MPAVLAERAVREARNADGGAAEHLTVVLGLPIGPGA